MKNVLIIQGPQGSGKTTLADAIKSLAPEKVVIVDGMSIAEVKSISTQTEFRMQFSTQTTTNPVELFIETVQNIQDSIFYDVTGNRRFNIMQVHM